MKAQILIVLSALLFCNSLVSAQDKDSLVSLPEITVTGSTKISNVLNTAFVKTFPDAQNVRWYKQSKDYLAKFIQNDMDHNALFKKNGALKYDVSFGYEGDLPEAVRNLVEADYSDFKITRAINVKEGGRDIWVVNLEGIKNYVIVRVENQELEEVQRYKKSQ
jgi:hypothetical protein